jgi:MFS family permease
MRARLVVVGSLFGLMVSFAPIFSLGVFLKPLALAFGWPRAQVSIGFSVALLTLAITSPFVGRAMDRFGPRRVILASSIAFAAALAAFAFLPKFYPGFVMLAAIVGVAGAGTTPLTYLALIARWFDRALGLALGIAMMGVGIGLYFAPTVGQLLLTTFGLKGAFFGLAAIAALAIPNALVLLRDRDVVIQSLSPTGDREPSMSALEVLRAATFWYLACAVFLMTLVVGGCNQHMVSLLTDRGYTPAAAAQVAAITGASLIISRLGTGFLLDHVSVGRLGGVMFGLGVLGVLLLTSGRDGLVPPLGVALVGAAQGAEGDIMAYAVRRCFGTQDFGQIYGWLFSVFNLGAFAGPVLMAFAFDLDGRYDAGLAGLAVLAVIATLLIARVRPPHDIAVIGEAR